jgi:hypothetical protein
MASVSSNNGESLVVGGWNPATDEPSNSDRYLARRLEAAGADYKGVALTNFLLGAAVAASVWLAVGVLAEHWIVPGGLPRTVRWGWLAVGLGALVAAAIRWLLPLVRYRVNLVYAARAIEREHPELHNDLVNTVLVKAHPEGSTAVVVRSLEKRAAKRLADVPSEGVIDRTLAVRLALALAAGVGIACLYELIAPKSLLVSAVRLVAPWAGISAPSRVRIDPPRLHWRMPGAGFVDPQQFDGAVDGHDVAVDRGSATLVRGRQLVLAAAIRSSMPCLFGTTDPPIRRRRRGGSRWCAERRKGRPPRCSRLFFPMPRGAWRTPSRSRSPPGMPGANRSVWWWSTRRRCWCARSATTSPPTSDGIRRRSPGRGISERPKKHR